MGQILAEPRRGDTKAPRTAKHPCSAPRSLYGQSRAIVYRTDAQPVQSSILGNRGARGKFESGRCDQVPRSSNIKQKDRPFQRPFYPRSNF